MIASLCDACPCVFLPHDFCAWVATYEFVNEASFRRFALFWGYSWFAIVKGWHAAEFAGMVKVTATKIDKFG